MSLEDFLGTWKIDETDNDTAAPLGHYINIAQLRSEEERHLAVAMWLDVDRKVVEVIRLAVDPKGDLVTTELAYGRFEVTISHLVSVPRRLGFEAIEVIEPGGAANAPDDVLEDPPLAGTWGAEDTGGSND